MTVLVTGAIAFFLLHRLVSAGPFRTPLARRFGEPTFLKLFGVASLVCLSWLTLGYWLASAVQLLPRWTVETPIWVNWPLEFLATTFIVAGAMTRNPGTAGMLDAVADPEIARGMLRITRHPFLWGVTAMSIGHILARPDDATIIYFGTLAVLAATGTASIDHKRRKRLGTAWVAFADRTSNIPFAAILQGRQSLRLREIGWRPLGASLALFTLVMIAHALLGGLALGRAN